MSKRSTVVKGGERKVMYAIYIAVDVAQAVLVATVIVGTIIDIFAGAVLLIYGLIRKLWTTKKLLILLATFVGEAIPIVNAMPFWAGDVWNLYSGVPSSEEERDSMEGKLDEGGALNKNGTRRPFREESEPPANIDGMRKPNGDMTKNVPPKISPPKLSST